MKYIAPLLLALLIFIPTAFSQTPEFTYQGRLINGGLPASVPHDFEFRLFAAETGGTPIGGIVESRPNVQISNGVFTVRLNFGDQFDGAARWLEISVKQTGGSTFAQLNPRQPLSSAPYSVKSLSSDTSTTSTNATQLNGIPASQYVVTSDPRMIDARTPTAGSNDYIQNRTTPQPNSSFSVAQHGYIGAGLRIEGNGFILPNTPSLSLSSSGIFQIDAPFTPSGRFVVLENGNVGIGNGGPTEKLEVAGNVKAASFSGNGAVKWQTVAGLAQQAQPNNGYLTTNDTQVTITLPTAPNTGDVVRISASGAGGWRIAQNAGQSVIVSNISGISSIGANWTPRESNRVWQSVTSSADGSKLVAVVQGGQIYTSTNSGVTWTPRESNRFWWSVASSADGSKLVAVVNGLSPGGQVYTSTDSGISWTPRDSNRLWVAVASSADGSKLVAAVSNGQLYTSTDSGATWTPRDSNRQWVSVASSADGIKLAAAVFTGQIYTSSDSGVTWTPRESGRFWRAVTSSADGTKLVAGDDGGRIYTSTDSGITWTPRESNRRWWALSSSADGSKLVALVTSGQIYISGDSGVSWTARESNRFWQFAASSADGGKLVAVVQSGQIYTSIPSTTVGATGFLTGGQFAAIELQYIGNGNFIPISHSGTVSAF